ncbi:pyridoxal-dependent decarboxylase, partial [Enterococcus sp. LJL99]
MTTSNTNQPIFGSTEACENVILKKLRKDSVDSELAYRLVKDQLIDEGNARQNMATFCQTYMEPEAQQLMAETFEKNAIDKSEYPSTAAIEEACVDIIADLWNAPDMDKMIGTS